MSSGERPIGTAKSKQPNPEALCQPPPPPVSMVLLAAGRLGVSASHTATKASELSEVSSGSKSPSFFQF